MRGVPIFWNFIQFMSMNLLQELLFWSSADPIGVFTINVPVMCRLPPNKDSFY